MDTPTVSMLNVRHKRANYMIYIEQSLSKFNAAAWTQKFQKIDTR